MIYFSTILISIFITVSLIPIMIRLAEKYQLVDLPDQRKVHTSPVPRIGGLAISLGAFVPVILWITTDAFVKAYLAGAGALVLFGLFDDMKGLGYKAKFGVQLLAALIVVFYGGVRIASLGMLVPGAALIPDGFAVALTLFAIVGVTNAINLSDGLDGLAGGISLLGFCCIGYLASLTGNNIVILLSLSLAGAIFGFLRFNTYPASLFMGDTGSQLLGFSAVVLAIKITQGSTPFSPILPLIILGFPVLDTLTVMAERLRAKRPLFAPDKNHFHHRLMSLGLSHTEAVFTIYVIQATLMLSAILFKYYSDWMLMGFYAVFSALIITAFVAADRMGFQLKRYHLIDSIVKGGFRRIRDERWTIRISFTLAKAIIPFLFLFSCILPAQIPGYVSLIAVCFSLLLLAVRIFFKDSLHFWLRFALYLAIPLLLYLNEESKVAWISANLLSLYHLFFGIITLFVLLTLKYSKRTKGFRVTTMDFLVIFITIAVPNLPDQLIQSYHLGPLAVKTIVLLFSYEVIITELRGRLDGLTASTVIALLLITVRGGLGF